MPAELRERLQPLVLAVCMLLAACGTSVGTRRTAPGHYAQEVDTATNTCLRNPACYTKPPGEQAILPWLSRAGDVAQATATMAQLLDAAQLARVEQILADCANEASAEVNARLLGGRRPTARECQEVVGKDARGQPVTRAMQLGAEKHRVALECARHQLGEEVPDRFSLEPRYQYDPRTGRARLLEPTQVDEWIRDGLLHKLLGTLVPDVVLHDKGNPLKVQAVYDFKFPCATGNPPSWSTYPPNHPYAEFNQGKIYDEALGKAARVVPGFGIIR